MDLFDNFLNDSISSYFTSCFWKKLKSGNSESQEIPQRQFESNFNRYEDQSDKQFESNSTEYQEPLKSSKPQTKNMLVLGELHRGVKQFENIQKILD